MCSGSGCPVDGAGDGDEGLPVSAMPLRGLKPPPEARCELFSALDATATAEANPQAGRRGAGGLRLGLGLAAQPHGSQDVQRQASLRGLEPGPGPAGRRASILGSRVVI